MYKLDHTNVFYYGHSHVCYIMATHHILYTHTTARFVLSAIRTVRVHISQRQYIILPRWFARACTDEKGAFARVRGHTSYNAY